MENYSETIEELNDILEKNYDAVAGFQKAAEKVNDNRMMGYFNKQVLERKEFINEITGEVRKLGGEPKTDGTVAGSVHRAWMNIKQGFSFSDDNREELLEECIRGEKNCIKEYNDLLEETHLPVSTRQMLTDQKMKITKTLAELEIKEERHDD